jgi:hypothetical protein
MNDQLKDFFGDLITGDPWSDTFLPRLMATARATWTSLPSLCEGLADAMARYASLKASVPFATEVKVTWLDPPAGPEGMCLIVFYLEDEMTADVALVNRRHFVEQVGRGTQL